jgi:hypothetical protein
MKRYGLDVDIQDIAGFMFQNEISSLFRREVIPVTKIT